MVQVLVGPDYFEDLVNLHQRSRQFYPGSAFFEHLEELLKSWTDALRQLWFEDEEPDIDEELDSFLSTDLVTMDHRELIIDCLSPLLARVWDFIYPFVPDLEIVILGSLGMVYSTGPGKSLVILSVDLFGLHSHHLPLILYHELAHILLFHRGKDIEAQEKEAHDLARRWRFGSSFVAR